MKIEINTGRTRQAGEDLLVVSKASANCGWEIDSVGHQLRYISHMEECRRALNEQQEALNVIAARLAKMGDALARISESYNLTELKNTDRLEECAPVQTIGTATIYSVQQDFKQRINRILYK